MTDEQIKRDVQTCVEKLERPENSDLLFAVLHSFTDKDGNMSDDFSFMYHFTFLLQALERRERAISNYQGENLNTRWERLIHSVPFMSDPSGAQYGWFTRKVQRVIWDKHKDAPPKAVEGFAARYTDLQREAVRLADEWQLNPYPYDRPVTA